MKKRTLDFIACKVSILLATMMLHTPAAHAQDAPPPQYRTAAFSDSAYLQPFSGIQFNIPVVKVPTRYVITDDSVLLAENLRQWTGFLPAYVKGRPGGSQLTAGLTHILRHDQVNYADSTAYKARGAGLFISYDLFSQFFGRPPFVFAWFLGLDAEGAFHRISWQGPTPWEHRQQSFNLGVEWGMRWFLTPRFYTELWMEPVSLETKWVHWKGTTTRREGLRRGVLRFAVGARF